MTTTHPIGDSLLREAQATTIKALAAIVNVPTPDKLLDLEAIPREPVMEQVTRIRAAWDKVSLYLAQHPQSIGAPVSDPMMESPRWKEFQEAFEATDVAQFGVNRMGGAERIRARDEAAGRLFEQFSHWLIRAFAPLAAAVLWVRHAEGRLQFTIGASTVDHPFSSFISLWFLRIKNRVMTARKMNPAMITPI